MAKEGHNSALTPEEEEALFLHHMTRLRAQRVKVAESKAAHDAEKSSLRDLFALAKADKFTRKELETILDDSESSRRDLTAEEQRRAKLRAWAGLPVGAQLDMFSALPEEAKDEQFFIGQGYAAGLRGEDAKPPEEVPQRFVQAWMRGYHDGQAKLIMGLKRAEEIIAARAPANETEDENAGDDEGSHDEIGEEAERLLESGFADFEASPEEPAEQIGRPVQEAA